MKLTPELVQQIFAGIRDHLITSSELKMNCYFLLACIRSFPEKLRDELEAGMEADLDSFFDVASIRSELEARRARLPTLPATGRPPLWPYSGRAFSHRVVCHEKRCGPWAPSSYHVAATGPAP